MENKLKVFTAAMRGRLISLLTKIAKKFNRVHGCDAANTLLLSKYYLRCSTRCKMLTVVNKEASDSAAFSASFMHNRNCLSLNLISGSGVGKIEASLG